MRSKVCVCFVCVLVSEYVKKKSAQETEREIKRERESGKER